MEGLREINVSRDEREAMLSDAMSQWWLGAIATMMKAMGPEAAMKAYGPTMRQTGRGWAERFVKEKRIPWARRYGYQAAVIRMWEGMMGIQGKVLEASPDKVVVRNTAWSAGQGHAPGLRILGVRDMGSSGRDQSRVPF